ncbi:MAG: PA14 domain-containing protein, partial [Candidatus Promineifilaceae bacterium]
TLAQGPSPEHSDPTWQAQYWNNRFLDGAPVFERSEAAIDYNWGNGSPDSHVNVDDFSARWTRYLDLAAGTYRFTVNSDDGIRLWVDSTLLFNDWSDHSLHVATADIALGAGHHQVKVEYYEHTGLAVARVSWALVTQPVNGWLGEYYNNDSLSGSPALTRTDSTINFYWGSGAPATGLNPDRFSVRWTQSPVFTAGNYRFTATADDGVRLWVNGHLLIDEWREQSAHAFSGEIYLPAGAVPIKMEYCELYGLAEARLSVTPLGSSGSGGSGTGGIGGTAGTIVDDNSAGFVKGGSPTGWTIQSEGYGGSLTWTRNNDQAWANYNWARWYPTLTPGSYEVFVYIPDRFTTTAQAQYWVAHYDGFTLRIVNQSAYSNQWVSLGTYRFRGTNADYVSLSDITYEPRLSRLIGFDAVKWEPR